MPTTRKPKDRHLTGSEGRDERRTRALERAALVLAVIADQQERQTAMLERWAKVVEKLLPLVPLH